MSVYTPFSSREHEKKKLDIRAGDSVMNEVKALMLFTTFLTHKWVVSGNNTTVVAYSRDSHGCLEASSPLPSGIASGSPLSS